MKGKKIKAKITPNIKSSTECCFKNTVERQINKAVIKEIIRQCHFEKCLEFQSPNNAAIEPITCIDGKTFVFVSIL